MKKAILLIAVLFVWASVAVARPNGSDDRSVRVTEVEVVRIDHMVTIFFTLHAGDKVVAQSNRSLVIHPVLRNGRNEANLAPIVILGARAQQSDARQVFPESWMNPSQQPYFTANGQTVAYSATFPYSAWMSGSELYFNGISVGRGKGTEVHIGSVADNLLQGSPEVYAPNVAEVSVSPSTPPTSTDNRQGNTPRMRTAVVGQGDSSLPAVAPAHSMFDSRPGAPSTGDGLSIRFAFVEPAVASQRAQDTPQEGLFNANMPLTLGTASARQQSEVEHYIRLTRHGALAIQFQPGSSIVNRDHKNNNRSLVELVSVVRTIESSADSRIKRVVIVGFCAPDGSQNENERLSVERATVAKDFLTANSPVRPDMVEVYGGGIDWMTLRELISESNMADKLKLLDIIDNTPANTSGSQGRLESLKAIGSGEPYRYMQENFFPLMRRQGAYIKVYYENIRR